tara:strand:- start:19608 stop:19823 length:216 start_codon:yes stop_codon:yes gene_type:complete
MNNKVNIDLKRYNGFSVVCVGTEDFGYQWEVFDLKNRSRGSGFAHKLRYAQDSGRRKAKSLSNKLLSNKTK